MERRKLSPLDEYIIAISEPPEFANQRIQFYNNLRHFYRKKWGCPLKVPSFHGVEVDLFKLYEAVVSLGGYQKVTNSERWVEVLRILSIDEDIQMAEYGIKMIYMRFLSRFELNELGNEADEHENDLLGGRTRLKNFSIMANTELPVSMPKQHTFFESSEPEYRKIVKSLLSGLPNEIDFAINICTLLSHPGPYLLRLLDCPQLISTLVAHCGFFADGDSSLLDIHFNSWQIFSGHDFAAFWRGAGIREDDITALLPKKISSESAVKASLQIRSDVFCVGDGRLDLKDVVSWRVFQVLSIIRNLSFEECNKASMVANIPLLKFLLACCYSKYQVLVSSAFDTLSNISSEIDLNTDGSIFEKYLLLKLIAKGLFSTDKFEILRSLEILTGLCNTKNNELLICDFVDEKVISRIFTLLTAKDILLCVFTLETIYQMSEMGRSSCEVLTAHKHSVDILVNLTTSDAASFGASGLAGIKVVEIHGVTGQLQPYHPPQKPIANTVSSNTQTSLKPTFGSPSVMPQVSRAMYSTSITSNSAVGSPTAVAKPPTTIQGFSQHQQHHHYQSYILPPPSPLAAASQRPPSVTPAQSSNAPTFQYITATQSAMPTSSNFVNGVPTPNSVDHTMASASKSKVLSKKFAKTRPTKSRSSIKNLTSALSVAIDRSPPQAVQDVVAAIAFSNSNYHSKENFVNSGESRLEHLTKSWINEHCELEPNSIANRGDMYACYVDYVRNDYGILACSMQMFINQLKTIFPSIIITHSPGSSIHAVEGIRFLKDEKNVTGSSIKPAADKASNVIAQHPLMQQMLSSPSATVTGTNDLSNSYLASNPVKGTLIRENLLVTENKAIPNENLDNGVRVASDQKFLNRSEGENEHFVQKNSDYNSDYLLRNGTATGLRNSSEDAQNHIKLIGEMNGLSENDIKHSELYDNGVLTTNNGKNDTIINAIKNDGESLALKSYKNFLTEHHKQDVFERKEEKVEQHINGDGQSAHHFMDGGGDRLLIPSLLPLNSNTMPATTSTTANEVKDVEPKEQSNGYLTPTTKGKKRTNAVNGSSKSLSKKAKISARNNLTCNSYRAENSTNVVPNDVNYSYDVNAHLPLSGTPMTELNKVRNNSGVLVVNGSAVQQRAVYNVAVPSTSAMQAEFMCEWDCCGRFFTSANAVLYHITIDHLRTSYEGVLGNVKPKVKEPLILCRWPACDTTLRSKWSMVSHLQDHHCTESTLQFAYRKRLEMGHMSYISYVQQRIEKPREEELTEQQNQLHHPGYSRFAAVDAIKRHAFSYLPKDITDDSEGPVTRSLRLTSCLILRNLAKNCVDGRRKIRKHESHLSWMALSKMESSAALAQCLGELAAYSLISTSKISPLPSFLKHDAVCITKCTKNDK